MSHEAREASSDVDSIDDTIADEEGAATQIAAPAARRRKSGQMPSVDADARTMATQTRTPSSAVTPTPGSTGAQHTMATTPLEALHNEEVERTRIFLKACIGITLSVAAVLPFLSGDALAKKLVVGACVLGFGVSLWLLLYIRDPDRYSMRVVLPVGIALAVASYAGVYFWGVFSPAPALILMGIYFFSLSASKRSTSFIYIFCAATQALMSGLVMSGALPDVGLVKAGELSARDQLVTQVIVQVLFLCAFFIARSSRKTTLKAIGELERAVRRVAQREAMLREVRQDLDRALKVGGPGRFTDQQLGSFRLGNLIGRGGMGEVYEAVHVNNETPAAVKLLHAQVMSNPDHVNRFIREIEVAASLNVENVVSVLEVGKTQGEVPFLAMERLHGNDLAYHLRKRRRLSMGKTIAMVRQVGRGLAAAHANGIVHRDVKPQNLFLARQGSRAVWKILDFGVSKLADHGGTLTKGHVVGTPGYMAPEQARGKTVDHRADLYALAAIAYRSLTGHPPFSGKDVPTTLYDVVYKMPKQPSELVRLPVQVDLVLAIALAKDRDKRFDSAEELANALLAASKGELEQKWLTRGHSILSQHPWGVTL